MIFINLRKIIKVFKKKLLVLLLIEALIIITILSLFNESSAPTKSHQILFLMRVIIVLDRTLGLTLIIRASRNSNLTLKQIQGF